MNWKKILWLVFPLLVVAVLISPGRSAGAASSQPGAFFVRLPAESTAAFNQLGLQAQVDLDYGAFRWLELPPAGYAVLEASGLAYTRVADGGSVSVMRFRFDPRLEGEPVVPQALRSSGKQVGLRLIQFSGPVQDTWLSQLTAAGMDVLQYYPSNAYLVWATLAQAESVAGQSFVRWQGVFHPAYKINPSLDNLSGRVTNVAITFYNDGDPSATLISIASLGGGYVQHYLAQPDGRLITAIFTLDASAIPSVARLETVWAVEYASPTPGFDDEVGAQIIAGNTPGGLPVTGFYAWLAEKGVNGAGITWADVDTGLDSSHPDITGRVVAYVNYGSPANVDPDGHGTHTAGAIFGDPFDGTGIQDTNGFYWGLGAAPSASLVVQNALMGANWPPVGGWQVLSRDSILNGAIGSSNSWYTGASGAQGYSLACRYHDLMVRDANFDTANVAEPIIMVFSAGNAGPSPSTMTEPKEAKNLITVGASDNYPRSGSSINGLAAFSSRGPALDGRLLPNVTAPGVQTASFKSSYSGIGSCTSSVPGAGGTYYSYCSGTSMAAPFVSGGSALIADWWNQEFGVDPSPAMVKALLINGAADMFGGSGVNGNIPNNNQGWGRTNLDNVIRNGRESLYYDQTQVFHNTGETWTINFGVPDPTQPLKISLVWSDAAGAAGASPALVNNLDLVVVNGGSTYRGNNFTNGWSVIGGSLDVLNNLENVYVQAPAGSASITIQATAINGDGIPYNGDTTDQDFALVCTNCVLRPDFTLAVTPSQQSICAPEDAVYSVDLGPIWIFDQDVTLSSPDLPAGLTADFDPNPVLPPGTSAFTVGGTGAVPYGQYMLTVQGDAITLTHAVTVGLELFSALPAAPGLLTPAAEARNVSLQPEFTWQVVEQGKLVEFQVATDPAFTSVVVSATALTEASFTPPAELATNTLYYWRVRSSNTCGESAWSEPGRFLTEAAIGQCALGSSAAPQFVQGFEELSLPEGWSTDGDGSTWASSLTRKHSGKRSFKGVDVNTVSDQWLISPVIVLPAAQSPQTVSFWNYRKFETPGCADGSVVEITTDGGVTWTRLNSQLRTDAYNGVIDSSSNPLYGQPAWCGAGTTWTNAIASLDEFAGESVQLRFRLGTDDSIGSEGWYVDDVAVQSCVPSADLQADASLEAAPGESIAFTFTLANRSASDDSFALALDAGSWPVVLLTTSPVTVTAGTTATLQVRLDVPEGTAGDTDRFTLYATSVGIPGIELHVTGTVTVVEGEVWFTNYLPMVGR